MILCDHELREALKNKSLIINPEPLPEAFDTSAVDLRLGKEFRVWRKPTAGAGVTINTTDEGFAYSILSGEYTTPLATASDGSVVIAPGELILAITLEHVDLVGFAARIEGKSTLARIGLAVHNTAPTIHFGFTGNITLELVNHGTYPLKLVPGQRICQLIVEQVYGTPQKKERTGELQGQTSVRGRDPSSPSLVASK